MAGVFVFHCLQFRQRIMDLFFSNCTNSGFGEALLLAFQQSLSHITEFHQSVLEALHNLPENLIKNMIFDEILLPLVVSWIKLPRSLTDALYSELREMRQSHARINLNLGNWNCSISLGCPSADEVLILSELDIWALECLLQKSGQKLAIPGDRRLTPSFNNLGFAFHFMELPISNHPSCRHNNWPHTLRFQREVAQDLLLVSMHMQRLVCLSTEEIRQKRFTDLSKLAIQDLQEEATSPDIAIMCRSANFECLKDLPLVASQHQQLTLFMEKWNHVAQDYGTVLFSGFMKKRYRFFFMIFETFMNAQVNTFLSQSIESFAVSKSRVTFRSSDQVKSRIMEQTGINEAFVIPHTLVTFFAGGQEIALGSGDLLIVLEEIASHLVRIFKVVSGENAVTGWNVTGTEFMEFFINVICRDARNVNEFIHGLNRCQKLGECAEDVMSLALLKNVQTVCHWLGYRDETQIRKVSAVCLDHRYE
jgi:hypothetical protein